MKYVRQICLAVAAVSVLTAGLAAAEPLALTPGGPSAVGAPVAVGGSTQFDIASKEAGRTYRVFVFKPTTPPPPAGYPVIVVTDGNGLFPIAASISMFKTLTGAGGALVVGVGYPTDDFMTPMMLRNRDLTPPTPLADIPSSPGLPPASAQGYGGSEEFYRFLTRELRPAIAARYTTDPSRQALYGHSLGGLFTLGVLFHHPKAFSTYVASSPSIWWNTRAVLKDEAGFAHAVESGEISPRILIMVGGEEQEPPNPLPPGMTRDQAVKLMNDSRMVDNARELGERLKSLKGKPPYEVSVHVFEDEDHISVMPASLSRAMAFASKP